VAWPEYFLKNGMAYQNKGMFKTCIVSYVFIMLDIATAYPYRLCHYNINKIILGPYPIARFPNMPLCNRAMSISTCSERIFFEE
jgi:hypothetical protein